MHFKEYKNILSPQGNMNLFRGCTHGCIYCDSRSRCYHMDHAFADVEVKKDAPEILRRQLLKRRSPCMIGTGSMCDPYLPLEEDLNYTRRCLEIIAESNYGVTLLTKSSRILRDLPLLKRINEKTKCVVQMTMTTFDETLCKQLEPNVSTTSERFNALCTLRDNGIPTVVWLCPILPFINDTLENLEGILSYCKKANVYGIICFGFGVTLREGNREYFYASLDRLFPDMKERYVRTFSNAYTAISPRQVQLKAAFSAFCRDNNVVCDNNAIFRYLRDLPKKTEQLCFL